jgi:hypothetical protein
MRATCGQRRSIETIDVRFGVPVFQKQTGSLRPDLVVSRMSGSAHRRLVIDPATGLNKYFC